MSKQGSLFTRLNAKLKERFTLPSTPPLMTRLMSVASGQAPTYELQPLAQEWQMIRQEFSELTTDLQTVQGLWQSDIVTRLSELDRRYQYFVQEQINPLLGRVRNEQMRQLADGEAPLMSEREQALNRHLAGSVALLGTALVGQTFLPILGTAVIATGLLLSVPYYQAAYAEWQQHHRIRLIHLGFLSNMVLWLGGNYVWGAFGMAFWMCGQKVIVMTQEQAHSNMIDVLRLQPQRIWLRLNGVEVEAPFSQVQAGDTLVIHAGQVIPVDGVVVAGNALVDQHMLTGESQPAEKAPGDSVLAATVVLSGIIDVRVEKTSDETMAAQVGQILNRATAHQVAYQVNFMEQAQKYVMPMLGFSALSFPLIGLAPAVALLNSNHMMQMLTFGPGTMWTFLNIASSGGALVKDGGALMQLQKADTFVFDKTGTLTLDQPQIAQIHALDGWRETAVLWLAAAAEARQSHPIARAILATAAERQLTLPAIEQAHYEVGYGIQVWLSATALAALDDQSLIQGTASPQDGAKLESAWLVRVGSHRFMEMEHITIPAALQTLQTQSQERGHSLVLVALGDQVIGCIELRPTVRDEAKEIVTKLRERGSAIYIISGDQEAPTRQLAQDLGMTGYFANTLPTQKADLVEKLQAEGRQVCFIGDGINDTIAMRKAFVSISLCGATTAATDTAKIVLMDGNLTKLLPLLDLVQQFDRTLTNTTRNFALSSLVSAGGLLFFHFTFGMAQLVAYLAVSSGLMIAFHPLYGNPMSAITEQEVESEFSNTVSE